ncbi:MAG: hypothetical protein WAM14_16285 [Candidatus Nitrosopolaris sp.]
MPYTELSEFYFVWLKRSLSDIVNNRLEPKFNHNAFFRKGEKFIEVRSQWEEFALREVSLNPHRISKNATDEEGKVYFQNLLNSSFAMMRRSVKSDGIIVTYYAHTDPDAWKALLKAGWESSGLSISNVFPIATESAQNIVAKGKLSLDTSIVVVWSGLFKHRNYTN